MVKSAIATCKKKIATGFGDFYIPSQKIALAIKVDSSQEWEYIFS